MTTLLFNAHIISPDQDIPGGAVLLEKGRIAVLFLPGESLPEAQEKVDFQGDYLFPGFFDIHTHGCANVDFCDASPEGLRAIAEHRLSQGVTSFLGTTLTLPEEDLARSLQNAREYMKNPTGAKIPGIHLEGPFFSQECAGAQNPSYLKKPDIGLVDWMNEIFPVRKVSYGIELDDSFVFTRQLVERGIMPAVAHSAATYEQFRDAVSLGLKHISHFCNVVTPMHHLRFGIVGGGLLHKDVFVELICDGIHLCHEMIQLIFETKGCDHIMLITDSMRAAGMPDGDYSLGGLPVVVKEGCARLTTGQVAGSTLLFHSALKRVRSVTGLPLSQLVKTTAWNQARSLGFSDIGKIAPGFQADIVRLNSELIPVGTWVNGELKFHK